MHRNYNKQQKIEFWSRHVEQAENFEGSNEEYCRSNNIAHQTFYKWRLKLKKMRSPVTVGKRKQIKSFIPVQVEPIAITQKAILPDPRWVAEFIYHLQAGLR
jgi:hypothetical protein